MRLPLVFVLALVALVGCESKDPTRSIAYDAEDLPCAQGDDAFWESGPLPGLDGEVAPGCEWVRFPGRTVVEIQHDLGRTPSDVVIYVAFSRTGASGTIASGDAGRIVGADDTRVVVENTTEQDFFVRVVLR
ncbi:MAG: hypothetical protein GXY23_05775 [Myxococcales bacterium]|nr:hypothetical protein [Myxococcales bacterium]